MVAAGLLAAAGAVEFPRKSVMQLGTPRSRPAGIAGGRGQHELPLANQRKGLRRDRPGRDCSEAEVALLRIRPGKHYEVSERRSAGSSAWHR
jgi:hypothetical protein